jgi:predicted double-glycine peptidase
MCILLVLAWSTCTAPACAGAVQVPLGTGGPVLTQPVQSVLERRQADVQLQRLDYSCGSAALATLFTAYLGIPVSEADVIAYIVRTGDAQKILVRKGFSLLDLKRFAEAHGAQAVGYELDWDSLVELQVPVLVPLFRHDQQLRHFVIFRGTAGDRVFLADPALGRVTMFRSEFEQVWQPAVGLVVSRPGTPPAAETPLGITAEDANYLTGDAMRGMIQRTVDTFIHNANEF